jgi:hypothetical protein
MALELLIISLVGALEVGWAVLVALVEDEAEVDGQVELDAEDVALDDGAEAEGGVEADEAVQQRAALLVLRDADLHEVEHVGAQADLERVTGALPVAGRLRRWDDRRLGDHRTAVGVARLRRHGEEEVEGKEESELGSHW